MILCIYVTYVSNMSPLVIVFKIYHVDGLCNLREVKQFLVPIFILSTLCCSQRLSEKGIMFKAVCVTSVGVMCLVYLVAEN
jgi:hypothetical protein